MSRVSDTCVCVFPLSAGVVEKTPVAEGSDEEAGNPFASANANGNPFEDEPPSPVVSVCVRALYEYEGQEQDELSFKAGVCVCECVCACCTSRSAVAPNFIRHDVGTHLKCTCYSHLPPT